MTTVLELHILPAYEGDCLWLSWGEPGHMRHALIDGGRKGTLPALRKRLNGLEAHEKRLELVVVSHIDRDHIEGMLHWLETGTPDVEIADIWFNGRRHLPPALVAFGAVMGEDLSDAIVARGLPWNKAFGGNAVLIPDTGALPVIRLDGGLVLTLLSPDHKKLAELAPVWDREIVKAGLKKVEDKKEDEPQGHPGLRSFGAIDVPTLAGSPFAIDDAEPNGSSIAFLADFDGRRLLFLADAHPDLINASLDRLSPGAPLACDLVKLAHHGSKANTSNDLLDRIECRTFVVSTNGNYFKHPDKAAVARVIHAAPGREIAFNYKTEETSVWDDTDLMSDHAYTVRYPEDGHDGHLTFRFS